VTAPKRILVAKPGLDGHDRGAKVVARALRDAGFEVIYTGLRQTPAQIAQAAVQEDVDAVGLSSLSGAHRELFPAVVHALREAGAANVVVFGGGVIPQEDVAVLQQAGIERLFPPGTDTREIVRFLRARLGVGEDENASASSNAPAGPSPSRR
jgi:methylmalonyl-CoA mutase C-terminal domain/subunit